MKLWIQCWVLRLTLTQCMAVALDIRWLLDDLNLILSGDTIPRFCEIGPKLCSRSSCSGNICSRSMNNLEYYSMLPEHFWIHNAPGAYSKYAPGAYSKYTYMYASGAVYIQIMLLEHIELRIFSQISHAPGALFRAKISQKPINPCDCGNTIATHHARKETRCQEIVSPLEWAS